uniref:Bacillithiol system redox-active protein YtxJ n=1 Tax=Roseihalotalea indica TaxID=2867963 RepID=A0AA49GJ71_9BACT|nr:bacillithiol system redox-active protein YtxJ [Tunicatimonas sp. TK19036]
MDWKALTTIEQLKQIKENSAQRPAIIYKHSSRCGISSMILRRLERDWRTSEMETADVYFLDLIRYRDVSQAVAEAFSIRHESPQILLINRGECVYDTSHTMISYNTLKKELIDVSGLSV